MSTQMCLLHSKCSTNAIIHTELPLDAGHKVRPCAEYKNEKEPRINNKK